MATKTFCDRCDTEIPDRYVATLSNSSYVRIEEPHGPDTIYCSRRCAVLALGGVHTGQDDHHTIPWPPSDELMERVAAAMFDRRPIDRYDILGARAVLDVIGGSDE